MNTELLILLDLAIVLVLAKSLEEIIVRLGQPPILGDLLAGIIIGPTVLGLITATHNIEVIGWLGIVVLIFLAGLETDIEVAKKYGLNAVFVGLGGVITTFILAYVIALAFNYPFITALFIATILTPTSVSVTSMTLLELGAIRTKAGEIILGAAFADDVMAMALFALTSSMAYYGEIKHESITQIIIGLIIVFGLFYFIYKFSDKLFNKIIMNSRLLDTPIIQLLIIGMLMAVLSSYLGLSPLIGAYLAGLALSKVVRSERTYRFFEIFVQMISPFFFVYAGILLNPWDVLGKVNVYNVIGVVIAIVLAGVIGKVLGCGGVAKAMGMDTHSSIIIGIGMMPRAGVDLVIAVVGLTLGVLSMELYLSALVLIYVTSLTTPILLKKLLSSSEMH
ncbi:MAG: cation:proton antiporter [Staphylothermus sp.]|nr:cation:proton antiporter [Staphylothermus sp.]